MLAGATKRARNISLPISSCCTNAIGSQVRWQTSRASYDQHVVVVGGGVMGVTTTYYLLKRGYKVTIIEKNDQVAQETSFQNGGK
jgi:heterodisulfide reductase subunit A-like polyferredoxin